MLITIFGESCTGKSTLAQRLKTPLNAKVYTGKDYKRLAKNEDIARQTFTQLLREAVSGQNVIWVISETEDLALLPVGAVRILATAELSCIQERFAKRMNGTLPKPVADMLERKHGCFDAVAHEYHISQETDIEAFCQTLCHIAEQTNERN